MNNTENKLDFLSWLIGIIIGVFLLILMYAPSLLIGGFIIAKFWEWFAQPLFHLSDINVYEAIGLRLLAGMIHPVYVKNSESKFWEQFAVLYVIPLIILLIGYVVHLYT